MMASDQLPCGDVGEITPPSPPLTNSPNGTRRTTKNALPQRPDPAVHITVPPLSPHRRNSRSQTIFDSHEYRKAIYAHSRRSVLTSSFPGRNYVDVADWLLPPKSPLKPQSQEEYAKDKHCLAVSHNLDGHGPGRTQLLAEGDMAALATQLMPNAGKGHLLFLQGYLSPSWIAELGSRYRIDPEFFCRHLDFFTRRNCFNLPSLASTYNNIIHLYVNTILTDTLDFASSFKIFSDRRRDIKEQLSEYKRKLQKTARCGDSLVREYTVLDRQYSLIEQRISICVAQNGDGWIGLVWMDNGRSLDTSPTGPWTKDFKANPTLRATALPVIQHHHKMAFRRIGDIEPSVGPSQAKVAHQDGMTQPVLPQGISILPLEYPSLLSAVDLAKRAKFDPLHALIPVFAYAAFSEAAFLNLVSELIEKLMEPLSIDNFRSDCFESLQEYEAALQRHANHLRHTLRSIRMLSERYALVHTSQQQQQQQHHLPPSEHRSRSPGSYGDAAPDGKDSSMHFDPQQGSSYTTAGILEDYEDLLDRCMRLLSRIATAMSTEMNRAMILESRRAIEQSERLKKLTVLATYFIPLTFTASLFGMNFGLLGQGNLPVWWYLVLAVPLTLLTHVIYSWNVQASQREVRIWIEAKWKKWKKPKNGILNS